MKYQNHIILLFLSSLVLVCYGQKDSKQFSLFSIVSFKQGECSAVSTSGLKGTCMTATECNNLGTADGNCAASFGVCCVVSVSSCGGTVSQNCTYIDNPSYPSSYTTTGDCSYTVTRCQDDICQIRLDFFSATLQQPLTTPLTTVGQCSSTILDITGGSTSAAITNNPPNLCGTLTGQHVYIDSGRTSTAATLKFTLNSASSNIWRIKVSQIECWNPTRAPEDCLQYFYGDTRYTVTSFNWDGSAACSTGCMLNDEDYAVCFRPEKGMCSQQFAESSVSSTLEAFGLNGNGQENAEITEAACSNSYVQIHSIDSTNGDRFCGEMLAKTVAATTGGVIYAQTSTPNTFYVISAEDNEGAHAGFSLDVTALACGMSTYGGGNNT